jgi:YbbR domain-containing protein
MKLPASRAQRWRSIAPTLRMWAGHLPLAVVSVALATLLWVGVTNEENPTIRRAAPFQAHVEPVNVPRTMIVSGTSPDRVDVTLTGARNRVDGVRPEDVTVRIDLSQASTTPASAGQTLRIDVSAEVSVRQRGVEADLNPQSIQVTLEPEVRRTVSVRVNSVDTLPAGYELAEPPTVQPLQVTVAGTRQNVDLVDAAVADVKLDGLTVNVEQGVELDPRDSAGHSIGHVTIEPTAVTVSLRVRQTRFSRQFLVDPHVRGRPAPGYTVGAVQVQPSTVSVSGSLDTLNQVSTLPTQDVDVEGATSDVVRTVGLQLPPGLTASDSKTSIVVRVPVMPQTGPGSFGAAPKIVGLGASLSATLQAPTVVVDVTGPLPTLLRLTPSDVVVTVDASGLGPGTYRLEPKVGLPLGIQLDGVVPDHVSLTVAPSSAPR